ncbi:YhgE/Pip family protein [Agromyces sp. MMS24-JH15]|uniref:YhgE/Pip family protein n=1 Tax=Agromyces sp. MMS24-JH15 TaxID=3243765 RepID=UPI0037491940
MKLPQLVAAEFRRLTASRMSVVALIALLAVPVLYGGLYLWANQDPYAKFADVPVALVVDDRGAGFGDDGPARTVGDEVADRLVADGDFDWHRVSADRAATGLDDSTYDFAITFPADFSDALASVRTDAPRRAELVLSTNDANSYLAGTIGEQAVERIRAAVAEQVGAEAASTLLDSLDEVRTGLADAADGASRLADGASDAADGASRLAGGASSLADGAASLRDGTEQVADGASDLAAGAAQVADGNAQLADAADRVGTAVDGAVAALPQARAELESALEAQGVDRAAIDRALASLDAAATQVAAGGDRVQEVVGEIDALADGSRQVSDGASALATGSRATADGAALAADGASALRDGAATLQAGLGDLDAGAGELRDGLADGAAEIPASTQATRDAQADTIADPVDAETSAVAKADGYGAGLAPFFAALAGWIGIYALFLIVKPLSRRAVTAIDAPIRVTLAGWLTPGILGALQMTALFGVLALVLGFSMSHPIGVLGIMLLASATFAAIILALNVWLGSVGQFLGLVLMVAQLVTAGGTFPWQTLPAPLAALHRVLPMGYVVDAMRQAMYGGELGRAWQDAAVLALWLLGALAIAGIGVTRMTRFRTLRDLQPSLIG